MTSRAGTTTHDVVNQALPLEDYDLLAADPLMSAAVEREGGGWGIEVIAALGRRVGSAEYLHWADQANRNPPELCTHDRVGHRQDEVEFHPAYHRLMEVAVTNGVHSLPYEHPDGEGARVVRDAMMWATPPRRWSSVALWCTVWGPRAGGYRPSSRWSTAPDSTV